MKLLIVAILFAAISSTIAYEYPEEDVEAFMENCTNGSSRKACRCMINSLQENVSYKKMLAMTNRLSAGNPTNRDIQILQDVSDECGGNFSASATQSQSPAVRTTPEYEMQKSRRCEKMQKNAKECWERESRMPDNSSKIIRQNTCNQMDMQYTTYCLH